MAHSHPSVGGEELGVGGRGVCELVVERGLDVAEEVLHRLPVCHPRVCREASKVANSAGNVWTRRHSEIEEGADSLVVGDVLHLADVRGRAGSHV